MPRGEFIEGPDDAELFDEIALLEDSYNDIAYAKTFLDAALHDVDVYIERLAGHIGTYDPPLIIIDAAGIHSLAAGLRSNALMQAAERIAIEAVKRDIDRVKAAMLDAERVLVRLKSAMRVKGWLER